MLIEIGEVIHVIERRGFESDVRRHFAGRVDHVEPTLIRATGVIYAFHAGRRIFERRPQERIRIYSLSDARNSINVLPSTVEPEGLKYSWTEREELIVRQGDWSMDLTEFVWGSV